MAEIPRFDVNSGLRVKIIAIFFAASLAFGLYSETILFSNFFSETDARAFTNLIYFLIAVGGLPSLFILYNNQTKYYSVPTIFASLLLSTGSFSIFISLSDVIVSEYPPYSSGILISLTFVVISIVILALSKPPQNEILLFRQWLLSVIIPITIFAFILLNYFMHSEREQALQQIISTDAANYSSQIQHDVTDLTHTVRRMVDRWVSSSGTQEELWRGDAKSYLQDIPALVTLAWVNPQMAITWMEPNEENQQSIEFIFTKNETRSEILIVTQGSTGAYLSDHIDLANGDKGMFISYPIFMDSIFSGWLLGLININTLLAPYTPQIEIEGYDYQLREGENILFNSVNFPDNKTTLHNYRTIEVEELNWVLHLYSNTTFSKLHQSHIQLAVSILVILLSGLLMWFILLFTRKQQLQENMFGMLYQRQSRALDTMVDGLLVISDKGIIQEVNRAALSIFGYKREELIGQNVKCMMPEPYQSEHDGYLNHYHKTGEQRIIGKGRTLKAKRKDGSVFPINLQVTEGHHRDDKFYTGVIVDLSEKVETERKLAEKDALLNIAVHASAVGFTIQDDTGKIIEVNDALCSWLGYSHEEILGKTLYDLTADNTPHEMLDLISETKDSVSANKQFRKKDGKLVWGLMSATVVRNSENKIQFVVVQIIDVQSQKELEAEIKSMQDLQNLMTDNNPDMIFVKNKDLKIISANPAFLKQYSAQDHKKVIGTTTFEGLSSEEFKTATEQDRVALKQGRSEALEKVFFPHLGERLFFTTKIRFENADGKPFILGISRDVTEREMLIRDLEKSNSDLDQFAYVASHDLKSPLNAIQKIIGWLEEDCGDILPDSSKEHFELLKSRSQRMLQLLNDLLQYSRISKFNYENETISLDVMVTDIFDLINAPEDFTYDVTKIEMNVPKAPLEIVLRNLISNSIKHHDKNKGTIDIKCSFQGNLYTMEVSDDGPGIPEDMRHKAIEMFQTLKSRDQVEGSGMGLAIVKKIVEHYGGELKLSSSHLGGACIIILWPEVSKNNYQIGRIYNYG